MLLIGIEIRCMGRVHLRRGDRDLPDHERSELSTPDFSVAAKAFEQNNKMVDPLEGWSPQTLWEGGATKLLLEQFSYFSSDLIWPRVQEAIRTDDLSLIDIDAELAQVRLLLVLPVRPSQSSISVSPHAKPSAVRWSHRTVMDHNFRHYDQPSEYCLKTITCECDNHLHVHEGLMRLSALDHGHRLPQRFF